MLSNMVIYVKDSVAKKFVEDRLSEAGKSNYSFKIKKD